MDRITQLNAQDINPAQDGGAIGPVRTIASPLSQMSKP
ncbi:protein of unknown function (plasmid) [Enterobacter cancerogenus]|nr:protein of unknown function [Enterobacter cancerogenus]